MQPIEVDPIARTLQSKYGLTVLAICLDRIRGEPQVLFDVTTGDSDGSIDQRALLTCPAQAIGLPRYSADSNVCDAEFSLPEYIGHALKEAFMQTSSADAPIWLRMAAPAGLLPIVPWEHLLEPLTGRSVLRLPYHEISPRLPTRGFDAVVCFSSPVSQRDLPVDAILSQFLEQVPTDLASKTAIHVFADAEAQSFLNTVRDRYQSFNIRIYDPAGSERNRRPGGNSPVTNPWLLWIKDSLGSRSADVVHFLCHSYLSGEEGALTLAESPLRNDDASRTRYVWADEMVAFLNMIGAWSVALTSPRENYSLTGLRMLQDAIARCRPGPCLVHDMVLTENTDALGQAYRFLYLPEWHEAPKSPGIALYCHPRRHSHSNRVDETSESLLEDVTLMGRVGEGGLGGSNPSWLSTAQRVLEQSATPLSVQPSNDEEKAIASGRRDALRFVADVLAKHSSSSGMTMEADSGDAGMLRPDSSVPNRTTEN